MEWILGLLWYVTLCIFCFALIGSIDKICQRLDMIRLALEWDEEEEEEEQIH